MRTLTLSSKNQIVVPRTVRAKLHLQSGDRLIISELSDEGFVIKKEPSYHELIGTVPSRNQEPVTRIRKIRETWG